MFTTGFEEGPEAPDNPLDLLKGTEADPDRYNDDQDSAYDANNPGGDDDTGDADGADDAAADNASGDDAGDDQQTTNEDGNEDDAADDQDADGEGEDGADEDATGPKPYTTEELIKLGEGDNFDKIDTSRLPPELMPIYKSFQRMGTKRAQRVAEQEKQLAQWQNANRTPLPPDFRTLVQSNPQEALQRLNGAMEQLNAEIHKKVEADEVFDAQKLMLKRDALQSQINTVGQHINMVSGAVKQFYSEVPDWDARKEAVGAFISEATPDDPLTTQDLAYLTNPSIHGPVGLKLAKVLNALHGKVEEAKKTVQKKLTKAETPKPLAKGGRRADPVKPDNRAKTAAEAKKRAIESGDEEDWVQYVGAITTPLAD